jgi:triphosphatase
VHEIELKLQVPPGRRSAIDAAVAAGGRSVRTRMRAAYHDTAGRALATAGLALRLRREGRRWVQTLKGSTGDAMVRLEHNVERGAGVAMPAIEPELHAGTAAGVALRACLAGADALRMVYATDLWRRARTVRALAPGLPPSRVELAFDRGRIDAGDASGAVCELELELVAGSPRTLLALARRWVTRHGLWLDSRSKAERGDLLARGEAMAPPRPAGAVRLDVAMDATAAWRAVLDSCIDQIVANASQIATGPSTAEHVHQLRVGLRRLRSGLRLFGLDAALAPLDGAAATLFRRLGNARDRGVFAAEFGAPLRAAMAEAGLPPAAAPALGPALDDAAALSAAVRETATQLLLLDLLDARHAGLPAAAPADDLQLKVRLGRRLRGWHRALVADAQRFEQLDDAGRHRLRKRAKRQRYALEFCGALFEPRRVRRYLKALRDLQDRLGAITDATMAIRALADAPPPRPVATVFALGWLIARRAQLVAQATPALRRYARARPFWK